MAMSRALAAAFLSHQVQELERAVATNPRRGAPRGRGRGHGPEPGRGGGPKRGHRTQGSEDTSGDDQAPLAGVGAIILDASVLVHCPAQVKRWCKDAVGPDLVVPLEVLNTLDLLKKGASVLAQRARAASRLLESFVGSDTRLRVQRDEAYVLWDDILVSGSDQDLLPPPEWLRRTLCCASWEAAHNARGSAVIAVADPSPPSDIDSAGRFDVRADGALVRAWVSRVGLRMVGVKPSAGRPNNAVPEALAPEPISAPVTVPRIRGKLFDPNASDADAPPSPKIFMRRPSDTPAPPPPVVPVILNRRGGGGGGAKRPPVGAGPRKPAAPAKEKSEPVRVVRLLSRGEKLDP